MKLIVTRVTSWNTIYKKIEIQSRNLSINRRRKRGTNKFMVFHPMIQKSCLKKKEVRMNKKKDKDLKMKNLKMRVTVKKEVEVVTFYFCKPSWLINNNNRKQRNKLKCWNNKNKIYNCQNLAKLMIMILKKRSKCFREWE